MNRLAEHPQRIIPILSGFVMLLMIVLLLLTLSFPVAAQENSAKTPTPMSAPAEFVDWYTEARTSWDLPYFLPGTSSGNANWTVETPTFESRYPNGFTFRMDKVVSDQGPIVEASIIYSHAPRDLRRRTATIYPTGEVFYVWTPDEALPPWVAVNYYWSFADSAGNRYRTDWLLGNEYVDETSGWERTESDEVIVFVQDGLPTRTVLNSTIQAMELQRETFRKAWGGTLSYKPRVILFANQDDFFEWQEFTISNSVVGRTDPEWGATVQVAIQDDYESLTLGTVLHEITHLYQFEYAAQGFGRANLWFSEGNATFFELLQDYDYEARVRDYVRNNQLPVLLQGDGPGNFSPDGRNRYAYDVGYTFWKWFVANYGLDGHRRVIELMQEGTTAIVALESVSGLSTIEMETRWREWLGASGPPPTLAPTFEYVFPPTRTPFIFPTRSSE